VAVLELAFDQLHATLAQLLRSCPERPHLAIDCFDAVGLGLMETVVRGGTAPVAHAARATSDDCHGLAL
jgi:hypothetical protein